MTSECHLILKILLEAGEWSQSQGGSLGSLFSPPHLRTKNWLVLGSGIDPAQEQVTRSTAVSASFMGVAFSTSLGLSWESARLWIGRRECGCVCSSNGPVDRF